MPRVYTPVYGRHANRGRVEEHRVHQIEMYALQGWGVTDIVRAMNGDASKSTVQRMLATIELCETAHTP